MKYELEPDNRNCADEVLLADLRLVAQRLAKDSLTKDEYNKHGCFSAAMMQNRFGAWNAALNKAGLLVRKRVGIPREELLNELKRVATALGIKVLSVKAYSTKGRFSVPTISRAFGTWAKALEHAGLTVSEQWHPKASDEELLSNMATVWESVGRQPRQSDFRLPLSRYSKHSYVRRFGSWRKALEAFVAASEEPRPPESEPLPSPAQPIAPPDTAKRTQRNPSWRLQFLVHRRDRFTCRACGRSPAMEPGVVMHVDHVTPWSKGGETTLENLQTLCERCNIGKGDLEMHANEG